MYMKMYVYIYNTYVYIYVLWGLSIYYLGTWALRGIVHESRNHKTT